MDEEDLEKLKETALTHDISLDLLYYLVDGLPKSAFHRVCDNVPSLPRYMKSRVIPSERSFPA